MKTLEQVEIAALNNIRAIAESARIYDGSFGLLKACAEAEMAVRNAIIARSMEIAERNVKMALQKEFGTPLIEGIK